MPKPPESEYRYVANKEELREILGSVNPRAANKNRTELHAYHREWIAASSFVLVSTSGKNGQCDVSPKGDPAGFTHIIDKTSIAIPERPGNRRADGFHNLLDNGHVGLLYLIPGRGDTLRINGRARLLRDAPFFDALIVNGNRPKLAILVEIEAIFFHCSKAFLRSKLWKPEEWNPAIVPPRSTIAHAMERSDQTIEEVEAHYGKGYDKELY